ncbi:MAG: DUF4345 domain-containing protein [Actinophytocola sp.]|nr:DUF4345 domain-containing protein [Actinophytocola sp.]
MTTLVLVVMAVFFAGIGLYGLAAPGALIRPFGVTLQSATARAEVRAVYGGFGLAIATVLAYAVADDDMRAGIALTVALALLGMAFGRLVACAIERPERFYPSWLYFGVEVLGGGVLLAVTVFGE